MLIDLILILSYLALAVAVVVTLWAVWNMIRRTTRQGGYVHGVPTRKIALGLAVGVVVLLLLTFLLGGSDVLRINGEEYNDVFVLKSSDMLINTSIMLIVITAGCAFFSLYREAKQMDKESNIFLDMLSLMKPKKRKSVINEVK